MQHAEMEQAQGQRQRTDHMQFLPDMEQIEPTVREQVIAAMDAYDYTRYTGRDVVRALQAETRGPREFAALLSPAAEPYLEELARAGRRERERHFGNCVNIFTPLYIANYCENYCIYCGFNCHNQIRRARLTLPEIEAEMRAIAATGQEEILLLTGESRAMSGLDYIGEACQVARRYFKLVGVEIYPLNTDEYPIYTPAAWTM